MSISFPHCCSISDERLKRGDVKEASMVVITIRRVFKLILNIYLMRYLAGNVPPK